MEYKELINYSDTSANLKRQSKRDKRKVFGAVFYVALNVVLVYVIYEGLVMRGFL